MPFDFIPSNSDTVQGLTNYHNGLAGEDSVLRSYLAEGAVLLEQRWRGKGAEIDLILRHDDSLVFVEVKKSKNFARAAERVSPRQLVGVFAAAEEYAARDPLGSLTNMRVDVALVNGEGAVEILQNVMLG